MPLPRAGKRLGGAAEDFRGFPRDFFRFFRELAAHNERPWFEAHKDRYRESVVAPMMGFIEAMAPRLEEISPHYRAIARPHGGSMFRIYRDTRFSRDKTPYKTHAGCHFRHELGKDAHAPGFYAHFENGGLFFGGGERSAAPAGRCRKNPPQQHTQGGAEGQGQLRQAQARQAGQL